MNKETNDFLRENLEEAHAAFEYIIKEMKKNNISDDYDELELEENNLYSETNKLMLKMDNYVARLDNVKELVNELQGYEMSLFIKYATLYIVSFLFFKGFHMIFDTRSLNDLAKYGIGMFLGSVYVGLLNKDISDNRSSDKETRDLINDLKTMKEEYKKYHDLAVINIDTIFNINTKKWQKIDNLKEKIR